MKRIESNQVRQGMARQELTDKGGVQFILSSHYIYFYFLYAIEQNSMISLNTRGVRTDLIPLLVSDQLYSGYIF